MSCRAPPRHARSPPAAAGGAYTEAFGWARALRAATPQHAPAKLGRWLQKPPHSAGSHSASCTYRDQSGRAVISETSPSYVSYVSRDLGDIISEI